MKTLIYFSILTATFPAFAATTFLQGSENGPSHIDPINGTARVNYRTDVADEHMKAEYNCPAADNVFQYRVRVNGTVHTKMTSRPNVTCAQIEQQEGANFVPASCRSKKAMEITLVETCGANCQRINPPRTGHRDFDLGSGPNASPEAKALYQKIKTCSPDEDIIIRDQQDAQGRTRGVSASMKSKTQCTDLAKRRVVLPGSPWDKLVPGPGWTEAQREELHNKFHIFTSPDSGFSIGNHTNYSYDFKTNQWCYQFFPEMKTAPVCDAGFNNRTFPILFVYPKENNRRKNFGAVKLGKDANGNPVAYIGQTKQPETNPAQLDETKPVMKVSMLNNDRGRSTSFQAMTAVNGQVNSTLQVATTMSFGRQMSTQPCHRSTCLRAISAVTGDQPRYACPAKPFESPLELSSANKDMCYSCNGVSPGACEDQKIILTRDEYNKRLQMMQSCSQQTQPPSNEVPTINQ